MAKDISSPAVSKISLPAAYLSMAGGATFLILFVALHFIKSDLDPSWRAISEYALGDFGWLMVIAFLAMSVSCASLLVAIRSQVTSWPGRIGLLGLVVATIGFAMAGIFLSDPITTKQADMTTHGMLHATGAVLADGIALAAIFLGASLVRRSKAWATVKQPVLWTSLLAISGFAVLCFAMFTMLPPDGHLGPDVKVGWHNRFMMVGYVVWVVCMAYLAAKLKRKQA